MASLRHGASGEIRVMTTDAHPIYRDGIGRVVRQRPRLRLVAETGDGASAIDVIVRVRPDVAVIDPATPGFDTKRLLAVLERDGIPTRVVLIAGEIRATEAYDALAGGAVAYLSKRATCEDVERAIRRAAAGEVTIAAELQTGLRHQIQLREHPARPRLSARELEVLRRLAAGMTAREIAHDLVIELTTVRTHVRRVCDKLDVRDRAAAVAVAMRAGLLD